jgi:guanylate kinase
MIFMQQSTSKRIILVGPAASGKDHARKELIDIGLVPGISYTTRPMRVGETAGVDYNYVSDDVFANMKSADEFYESKSFNGWSYGTTKNHMTSSQLFIITPSGLADLKSVDRAESIVIFFNIDSNIRRSRLGSRADTTPNQGDSINRRLIADQDDFENYIDWDIMITDPTFDIVNDVIRAEELATNFNLSKQLHKTIFNEVK